MIISFDELSNYRQKVTMVDGGFDPLHHGHVAYFQSAAELGLPVLCNISSDRYVASKHPPLLAQDKRTCVIDALESIALTHANEADTRAVLKELQPRYYVKGRDWEGRLPAEESKLCADLGIEVVYLDTIKDSSSNLMRNFMSNEISNQVTTYEDFVLTQTNRGAENYDKDYFNSKWREGDNSYDIETRRRIEARNPQLIKDTFAPKSVLDMGCGPGALMYLLDEIGVHSDGIDFAPESKTLAPETVRDRIRIGSVTDIDIASDSYDLVICREVFEHLTVLQVQQAVQNICRISSNYVYFTTRFHPEPETLFDVTTEFDVDPTHITLQNKDMLRLMIVLQGYKRRADLEKELDWLNKNRVLVYQKINAS